MGAYQHQPHSFRVETTALCSGGFWKKSGKNQLIITLLPASSLFPRFYPPV